MDYGGKFDESLHACTIFYPNGDQLAHIVPMDSAPPIGDVAHLLANSFYSVLVSISVFMALSTVFHSINPPDMSLLSHSFLPVLFLLYRSFQ